MLDGYNRTFWAHAANSVFRELDVPDVALGIDAAGNNNAVPVRFFFESGQKIRAVRPPENDITYMQPKGSGQAIRPEDFPSTGYFGDYLQGW